MAEKNTRVLVSGPAWVGDMVMAQVFLKALKQRFPLSQIDLIVPASLAGLVERMPEVSEVIQHEIKHGQLGLRERRKLGHALRGNHYHRSYVLQRSFKSALIPWFANVPNRIGHVGEMRWGVVNKRYSYLGNKLTPHVCNYLQLLDMQVDIKQVKKEFAPRLTVDSHNQYELLQQFGIVPEKPVVALLPGAEFGPSKQWPIEYFLTLAKKLVDRGVQVIVLGGPKEKLLCDQFDHINGVGNLAGQTSITDVIDLLAGCKAAVSNDSGLMHIAAAVQCPIVCLYGATSPVYTPPLSERCKILYLYLECSPCWQRTCHYEHYRCLRDVSVEHVEESVLKYL